MIEDFVKLIPKSLMDTPGTVLRAGRRAFESPSDLYILDYHPGGTAKKYPETIGQHINKVLDVAPDWVSWSDEKWGTSEKGEHRIQKRVRHLFAKIHVNPRETPAGLLIYKRYPRGEHTSQEEKELAEACWPFHEAVIDELEVRVVVCLGQESGKRVCKQLNAQATGDNFTEMNERRWTSRTYQNPDGLYVISLTNPSIAKWTNPAADPTELVQRALERVRNN